MNDMIFAAPAPIPAPVPPGMVTADYPLILGATTTENPFDRIVPEAAAGPDVRYSTNVYPGGGPAWIFRRAEVLRAIYKDTEHFSTKGFSPFAMLVGESWHQVPVEYDPPEHTKFRNLINPLLAPQKMAALDEKVRGYARNYIDRFRDKGECEFMGDFAFEFPIAVFMELMGLPQEDVQQLLAWEMKLLHEPDMAEVAGAVRNVNNYLAEKMEERRRKPTDDFISFAVHAEVEGRPLSHDELVGLTFGLYIGGLDTVSTYMGLHFRHLAEHQEHQAELRAHPERIPLATEELLRAYAAVTTFRTCVKETEVAGVRVMPGDKVAMSTTLACRDESKYDSPSEVRLDRGPQHETFAFGPHRCVGMHLARRELQAGLEEFLKAIPQFRIKPDTEIVSELGAMIQPKTLPLVWDA
jgi:cytochrome P450